MTQAEIDAELDQICEERWAEFLKTGQAVSLDAMDAYLEAKLAGQPASMPKPRKITE